MIGGALKLAGGVGRLGLGAAGAAMTPLMVPMAIGESLSIAEKLGYDPTGGKARKAAPYRAMSLEEAILDSMDNLEERSARSSQGQFDTFDQDIQDMIERMQPRFAAAAQPMQGRLDPVTLAMQRGLL